MTNDTELREDVRRRYAKAATTVSSGAGEACDNLADMYDEGYGVPQDRNQAAVFRKRACALGDRDACGMRP